MGLICPVLVAAWLQIQETRTANLERFKPGELPPLVVPTSMCVRRTAGRQLRRTQPVGQCATFPVVGCRYHFLKVTTLLIDPFNLPALDVGWPAVGTIQSGGGSLRFTVRLFRITLQTRPTAHPLSAQRSSSDHPPFYRNLQTRLTTHPNSTQRISFDRPPF